MNIKRNISKLVSGLLCFSMIFGNVLPAYAADAVITENTLDGEDLSVNEKNLEDITVTYKQASSFFVTIPKTIVLDGWKQSTYAVKVSGDIDADQCVYVAPVDVITDTENIDFYMKDQASENAKDDVVANVTHNKFYWSSAEVAENHKQDDNLVSAPDLTAGAWKGIFQMEIKLETHVTHKHNYVETVTKEPTCTEAGEKTYTCDCGDGYTEEIPAKGHHFEDGECTDCGEKDPNHKHNYAETITKEPTCTEAGEKTFTCDCGDSYIQKIPAKGHHYEDGECTDCGEKDPDYHEHSYDEGVVTKEPTCTEKGEKTFTCSGCGHTYTEEIPAKDHNYENNICTNCGESDPSHVHNYEPYEFMIEPQLISSTKGVYPTQTNKYTKWMNRGSKDGYSDFYVNSICTGGSTGSQFNATAEIVLPDDYEGEYNYKYYFTYTMGCKDTGAAVRLSLNGSLIHRYSVGQVVSAIGSTNTISTIPLHAGKNTVTLQANFYNASGSANPNANLYNWYDVYLENSTLFDGSDYHICNDCGKKEEHHFVDGVCIECGWHEGDHTHHYVDGFCDKCGKDETQYILKIDDSGFLNEIGEISSETQYIRNGDILELPEKTDDTFDLSGYSIVRAVKNIRLCSSNLNGTNNAIYVQNSGPGYCVNWSQSQLDQFGLQYMAGSNIQSELTDYMWKQTAISDTIVIEKPSVYVFSVNEQDKCELIYDAGFTNSHSLTLQDIRNNKTYTLPANVNDENVKIRSTRKMTSSTSESGKYNRYYQSKYMIYLEPGEYRLSAEGKSGNGGEMGGKSLYSMGIGSPFTANTSLAAPIINNVKHTAFGGTLYELIPIEDGQEFDFSTMYSNETSQNIYLISNWTAKAAD